MREGERERKREREKERERGTEKSPQPIRTVTQCSGGLFRAGDTCLPVSSLTQTISNLQSSYNTACDWKQNTGAGIIDSDMVDEVKTVDGMSPFHLVANRIHKLLLMLDQIHPLCQYWDILDPIMGLRHNCHS
ncbi:hypothetical protein VP01_1351g1 [Puccinia sorghi]|uniref:Uncharacterized protein n=1 Tax=Puccinia sorghi TaxID=27349 RepID=A0A0L6VMK8_9BASI|nr:hypothetical protein VP01_1351g1 [Puccinia sorghi]